jgi:hypothetical protein
VSWAEAAAASEARDSGEVEAEVHLPSAVLEQLAAEAPASEWQALPLLLVLAGSRPPRGKRPKR